MTTSQSTTASGEWAVAREDVEDALQPQRKLIAELMHSKALAEGDIARALQQVTEVAARALRVDRASVWRLCDDAAGVRLECADLYERAAARHTAGAVIRQDAAPRYFHALAEERTIAAHDACKDPRTSELADSYLGRFGISAMLDAPVFVRGKMVAVVCHEHVGPPRRWHFWEELIAGTCSDFVALVMEGQGWARAERELRLERDSLEQKVAERTAELRAGEEGLRAILDVTPVALVATGVIDHRVIFANPRAYALFEVPVGDVLGLDASSFWLNESERHRFLLAAAKGRVEGQEAELRTRSGRTFWARLAAAPLRWMGQPALLASVDDISLQKRAEAQLRELATRDVLTGIHNRRSLADAGATELDRARRYGRPFSAAMIDVDHFKRVNDEHGHAVGDDVLRAVVGAIADRLRGSDLLGRWGGEEFVVLLPETDVAAAERVLDRVRGAIAERPIEIDDASIHVTISIGVAEWTGIESLSSLVERADQACYGAKRGGRNRIVKAAPR